MEDIDISKMDDIGVVIYFVKFFPQMGILFAKIIYIFIFFHQLRENGDRRQKPC